MDYTRLCLYSLGFLSHYHWVSFPLAAVLIVMARWKVFSKSCAIMGIAYLMEQRIRMERRGNCCGEDYFEDLGLQTAKLLPMFFLFLLSARAFRDESFTESLDHAHSSQVAAFFHIFPSYAFTLFDLFEANFTLATFASLVLISAVTFGNYRSVMFLCLRKLFGRYCMVVGSAGLNLLFLSFDSTIRGLGPSIGYWAVRQAWSVVASYEVEAIFVEKQVERVLDKCGEDVETQCLSLLKETTEHSFLKLPPEWARKKLQSRLLRLIWKHCTHMSVLTPCLSLLHDNGAIPTRKITILMLRELLHRPDLDLYLLINQFGLDYALPVHGNLRFVEAVQREKIRGRADWEALEAIAGLIRRKEARLVGLIWLYQRKALGRLQLLTFGLLRDLTFYIA
jgi:hypothetical protein